MACAFKHKMIALDTNMLLAIANEKIDIFSQIKNEFGNSAQIVVPKEVIYELEVIARESKKLESAAKIAFHELKANNAKILAGKGNADNALLELARKGVIIATNDKQLKKEIKKLNGGIIFTRKRRFLVFS